MVFVTSGSIKKLCSETTGNEHPVVQVINIKPVTSNSETRYRFIISDGEHIMQAMLASQLTSLVESNDIVRYAIIRLKDFVCHELQGRKILIILNLDVVSKDQTQKIGNPQPLDGPMAAQQPQEQQDQTSQAQTTQPATATPSMQLGQQYAPTPMATNYSHSSNFSTSSPVPDTSLFMIKGLNPYQNRWTIKARVTQKSAIKEWHNARSDGKLFSVNLLDKSGEIKATAFREQVDRWHNILQEGKVYYISKARVTMAKKQFSTLDNEYELVFGHDTEIELCNDEGAIPQITFNFVKIADLEKYEKGANIDIVAVVKEVNSVQEIVSKISGKPAKKRELLVVDDSQKQVRLTLWDRAAEEFTATDSPIVTCKGVRVNDFDGRSLSLSSAGILKVNVDIPEVHKLRKWYDTQGSEESFVGFRNAMPGGEGVDNRQLAKLTIQSIKDDHLGSSDRPDYFSTVGTVTYIKNEGMAYPACPDCKKKMVSESVEWRCEKCQKTRPSPDWRYILMMGVVDETGQLYMNAFDEVGQRVVGMDANELMALRDSDQQAFQKVLNEAANKTYKIKGRAKMETFNDQTRTKYQIVELSDLDYAKEGHELVAAIEKLMS